MKTTKLFTIVLVGLMLISFSAFALDEKAETKEVKKETAKKLKYQTNCPVMGGKIDSTTYTDIQGQRVYHCCPGCSGALKKDPDKFFKIAAADGILYENVQASCPISGKELKEKIVYTDFDGRRIYFCCTDCQAIFDKDPQKILGSMDDKKENMEMKKDSGEDHSGHNH